MTWRFNDKEKGSCFIQASLALLKFCAFIQSSRDDLVSLGPPPHPAVGLSATGVMVLRFPGSPEGPRIIHTGPATLTSQCCTVIRVPMLLSPKAAAHTRFLNKNPLRLRLSVPLVSLELFFQEHNVH